MMQTTQPTMAPPTTRPSPVVAYGTRPPIARRVNFRMLIIVAVFGVLVGYPVYQFVKAQHNGGIEHTSKGELVDLKAMGNFPFNDTSGTLDQVPAKFRGLDGKQVILEGFIYSGNSASDRVHSFQFVYNVTKCCFSGPPQVQERVFATVPNSVIPDPGPYTMVRLSGIMHVKVVKDDAGKISSVYNLDVNGAELVS